MLKSTELLRSYVLELKHESHAAAVSMFVPAFFSARSSAILIHSEDEAAVPELADLSAAQSWLSQKAEHGGIQDAESNQHPSGAQGGWLIEISAADALFRSSLSMIGDDSAARRRRRSDELQEASSAPSAWIGLRFDGSGAEEVSDPGQRGAWRSRLLPLGGVLAWHVQQVVSILADPVTGLPGRTQFQADLTESYAAAKKTNRPLCLLFINPDDFAGVNERFGREPSDCIIREIAENLRATIRSSDIVAKYGGVIFVAVLHNTPLSAAKVVAENVLRSLTERAYLEGAVRLGFSIGVATFDPRSGSVEDPLDLTRRADQALNAAKRSGGGCIMVWEAGSEIEEIGQLDRLAGIFTGQMAKDYRNMVMLWDILYLMAANLTSSELEEQVVERLQSTLKLEQVGLFGLAEDGEPMLKSGLARQPASATGQLALTDLNAEELDLVSQCCRQGRLVEANLGTDERSANSEDHILRYAVPLLAAEQRLGCLYLGGRASTIRLDGSDLIFLQALAAQLAVALDRARLAEQERGRMRTELNELREALQKSKLVYRSPQMSAVLATARRVAPTDATVLITGESGTGKELLARTIHELSPRRKRPLVIVDCAAISSTLIDSELFGHERGAYTGAQARTIGRLTEADGGTVLLDEIAELPLDVQSKLLRFVQEKQLTPVGSTKARAVDVRVIAATNRDLATEVAARRFREDLYHRLNVVRLLVPPLRERPQDILYLAQHYIHLYSKLYHKTVRGLSREGRETLLAYPWQGNVRELQNRIMQAVILCDRDELTPTELGLNGLGRAAASAGGNPLKVASDGDPVWHLPQAPSALPPPLPEPPGGSLGGSPWERLREELVGLIERTLRGELPMPYGRWMSDDLVLLADQFSSSVARRAAKIVGLPETTYRRRLLKASEERQAGLAPRTESWDSVREALAELVRDGDAEGQDLLERTERLLLKEIVARFPKSDRTGSALLGVTVPTYRRRTAQLRS